MLWINFLHLYQPANAGQDTINEAIGKSYERILRALEENPNIKFTLNITGCLVLRLTEDINRPDIIKRINNLAEKKQIELVSSAAYHPLLPLIDLRQAKEQIVENNQILKKYFGNNFKKAGFFLSELAYSQRVAQLIKQLGFKWIILDEISTNTQIINPETKYIDQASGLNVVFRNQKFSQTFIPETILNNHIDFPLITATDAELYGLRHIDQPANFEKSLKSKNLKTQTISEFLSTLKNKEEITLNNSSWETTKKELSINLPFSLWQNKKNKIHTKLWELANLAQEIHYKYNNDENIWWSKWHLVRGLASCNFWWASNHDLRKVFGPIAWNPDHIELGANELIRSIRDLEKSTNITEKLKAEQLFVRIIELIWKKHWKEIKSK